MTVAFRHVLLSDLTLDHKFWSNPRVFTGMDDKEIAELAADIKLRGIQSPLLVQRIKATSGGVTDLVLDGQRRVLAALEVMPKNTKIPVADRTEDPIELTAEEADRILLDMLAVGQKREGLSSFELSEVAEKLRNRDRTLIDIAKAIGKSESWVSKFLKARTTASPTLMLRWRKGAITDEQFKELAEVKDLGKQAEAVKEIAEARKDDKAEARVRAKEITEGAKKANGVAHKPRSGTVTPAELSSPKSATPVAPKRSPAPSRAVLEDMLAMADKRPPTHDYVKGLMDGVGYSTGELEPKEFGKPWAAYLARIDGSGRKAKATRKARKPGGKARRGGKKSKKGGRR